MSRKRKDVPGEEKGSNTTKCQGKKPSELTTGDKFIVETQSIESIKSPTVLLIGEDALRVKSTVVTDFACEKFQTEKLQLHRALFDFRAKHGFGRSIAANQIGITKRFLAINLGGKGAFTMINPEIIWRDSNMFTLWDDCMSFPWLLVKVKRNNSISVRFNDDDGNVHVWNELDQATSELLQHEIDHLDAILATDRAVDERSIISRTAFDKDPDKFQKQVDYLIQATI